MKTIRPLLLGLFWIPGLFATTADQPAFPALAWEEMPDNTGLALINTTAGRPVWRAVCDPGQPKPYIYPLATLDGVELTANSPADHVWHHSLGFAWKYINGVNYWEVDKQTGRSDGLTTIKAARFRRGADFSARIELAIDYAPPGQPPLLRELRVLVHNGAGDAAALEREWKSFAKN